METYNLGDDLAKCHHIVEKVRASKVYAQNLYASMCNMKWQRAEVWPILKGELCSYSWRSAGGLIADLREEGDYLTWYCSGIIGDDDEREKGYVGEGMVTEEIREDLKRLGWIPVPYDDDL
jgi:hypothetical protein